MDCVTDYIVKTKQLNLNKFLYFNSFSERNVWVKWNFFFTLEPKNGFPLFWNVWIFVSVFEKVFIFGLISCFFVVVNFYILYVYTKENVAEKSIKFILMIPDFLFLCFLKVFTNINLMTPLKYLTSNATLYN